MIRILTIIQVVISCLLIVSILMQQRGEGLSQTFGGSGGSAYRTRRGLERILLWATVGLAVLFVGIAVAIIKLGSLG